MPKTKKESTSTDGAVAVAEAPAEPEVAWVTSTELAEQCQTQPTILRRWLRTLPQYQDGGYTRYKWDPADPFLSTAVEQFAQFQASAEAAKIASETKKADKEARKTTKASTATAEEEDDTSEEEKLEIEGDEDEISEDEEPEELK